MSQFPHLNEEDFSVLTKALEDLLAKSEASTALMVEKSGYLVHRVGDLPDFDGSGFEVLATLTAQSFVAMEVVANRLGEENFANVYQQGDNYSLFVVNVNENCLLQIIFPASMSVGAVKYYASEAVRTIDQQLQTAQSRMSGEGYDFATMDVTDMDSLFNRKDEE